MRKTVLITGASRGIGRAIAVAFAKADYNLVITCSRSESELLSLKDELETVYSVDVLASIGDISDYEYVVRLRVVRLGRRCWCRIRARSAL